MYCKEREIQGIDRIIEVTNNDHFVKVYLLTFRTGHIQDIHVPTLSSVSSRHPTNKQGVTTWQSSHWHMFSTASSHYSQLTELHRSLVTFIIHFAIELNTNTAHSN